MKATYDNPYIRLENEHSSMELTHEDMEVLWHIMINYMANPVENWDEVDSAEEI